MGRNLPNFCVFHAKKYTNLKKVHHRRCWRRWLISAMKQANYSLYIQHINLNLAHSSKPTFYGASNRFVVNFCWLGLFGGIWIYGLNYSHINRMFWWRVLPLKCSMKGDKTSHNLRWPDFGSPSLPVSISLLKTWTLVYPFSKVEKCLPRINVWLVQQNFIFFQQQFNLLWYS